MYDHNLTDLMGAVKNTGSGFTPPRIIDGKASIPYTEGEFPTRLEFSLESTDTDRTVDYSILTESHHDEALEDAGEAVVRSGRIDATNLSSIQVGRKLSTTVWNEIGAPRLAKWQINEDPSPIMQSAKYLKEQLENNGFEITYSLTEASDPDAPMDYPTIHSPISTLGIEGHQINCDASFVFEIADQGEVQVTITPEAHELDLPYVDAFTPENFDGYVYWTLLPESHPANTEPPIRTEKWQESIFAYGINEQIARSVDGSQPSEEHPDSTPAPEAGPGAQNDTDGPDV